MLLSQTILSPREYPKTRSTARFMAEPKFTRPPVRFFTRQAQELAPALIGCKLVRTLPDGTVLAGIIVETEAYLGAKDRCAHTFGGRRTPRNESMYRGGGHAYVYFTYGMHHCVNIVCGRKDDGIAVLVRALRPTDGLATMREHRTSARARTKLKDTDLASGPGKLCQALAIGRDLDGTDLLTSGVLYLEKPRQTPGAALVRTVRVGVGSHKPWSLAPLRWYLLGDPNVSVRDRSAEQAAFGSRSTD